MVHRRQHARQSAETSSRQPGTSAKHASLNNTSSTIHTDYHTRQVRIGPLMRIFKTDTGMLAVSTAFVYKV